MDRSLKDFKSLVSAQRFTFKDGHTYGSPDTHSLEPILARLLDGDVNDPAWRQQMRDLLSRCSQGPFDVSDGDPQFDPETVVVVTNRNREILAKCGPVRDARSCFDAIAFAAALNAIRNLVTETADA